MNEHFCTYFDHRYAPKGLAMWKSLKSRSQAAILHVLCLNDACREILAAQHLPDVCLHSLNTLETADPELLQARGDRSLFEYYFTLTPCLPLHLFDTHPDVQRLTYIDADLFFFADPAPIFQEAGDAAVALIEHRFPDELSHLNRYGRFNVGWLTFRRDPVALGCLDTWRKQCLEWCHDRLEPGRYAEQKYLDDWPITFPRVHVIQHRGANVGPWNLSRFELSMQGEELRVGGEPLLFFHAHGFQPESPGRPRMLNLDDYGVACTPVIAQLIFQPYEKALDDAIAGIAASLVRALLVDASRGAGLELERLQGQLAASDADRVRLQKELTESEADRAARLAVIHTMQEQLQASEADRAARLELIHSLQEQLATSAARGAIQLDRIHTLENLLKTNESELGGVRRQLVHTATRLEAIEHSRSWRWTRLARAFADPFVKPKTGA